MPAIKHTMAERVTILETKYITVIEPMKKKIDDIYKIVKQNSTDITGLQVGNPHNDTGNERRKGTLGRMPTWKKVSAAGVVVGLFLRHEIREFIELAFKWYLDIPH